MRGVLDGYADAFSTLNADATQRVWPGVDVRGLRRAFDQLSTQNITFNRCEVNASGETAQAVCTGRATWVPKVGDRSPKSEPRTWRFALGRDDGAVGDRRRAGAALNSGTRAAAGPSLEGKRSRDSGETARATGRARH